MGPSRCCVCWQEMYYKQLLQWCTSHKCDHVQGLVRHVECSRAFLLISFWWCLGLMGKCVPIGSKVSFYAGEKFTTKSVYGRYCWQSCLHQWCAKVTTISSFMLYIFGFWTFGRKSFRHRKTHFTCYFCTPLYHPSSGKQNVLASASNKSPHFPHEFPVLALRDFSFSFSSSSFFCCSRVTRGTVTSSPALISKGLQSSPTKWVFIQSFGWRSFDTSTKWIFWRNQLDPFPWFRPTLQHFLSHFRPYFLSDTEDDALKSNCCCKVSSSKAICWPYWPSCPAIMTRGTASSSA